MMPCSLMKREPETQLCAGACAHVVAAVLLLLMQLHGQTAIEPSACMLPMFYLACLDAMLLLARDS